MQLAVGLVEDEDEVEVDVEEDDGVTKVITLVVPAGSVGTIVVSPVCVLVDVTVVRKPVIGAEVEVVVLDELELEVGDAV